MSDFVKIDFSSLDDLKATSGSRGDETLVVFVGGDLKLGETAAAILGAASGLIATAAATAAVKGKAKTALDILAPVGLGFGRLLVIGTQAKGAPTGSDGVALGGFVMGKLRDGAKATVLFDLPGAESTPKAAADFAQGVQLRAYRFDRYKTKKEDNEKPGPASVTLAVRTVDAAREFAGVAGGIADGVELARTLVNEPPRHAASELRANPRTRPHARQRAAERPLPDRVRAPRRGSLEARGRDRDPRHAGHGKARHAGAARRGAGLGP